MTVTAAQVEQVLRAALSPEQLLVVDDSHLHAGHAGALEGRHFTVRLTAHAFTGQSRVTRHRMVYAALQPLIAVGIHALAIEARAPGEA